MDAMTGKEGSRRKRSLPALFLAAFAICGGCGSAPVAPDRAASETVTVRPAEIDDILYNPGMGIADFHFGEGWKRPYPRPEEYPRSTVAYFRWTWAQLEPSEGRYDFGRVDNVIRAAKARGETLAFRIMPVYKTSTPKWLLDKGVAHVEVDEGVFPDHNDPAFLRFHERLIKAFGDRYAGRPEIDHVDIGSVGCWGEWNTACCPKEKAAACSRYFPTRENRLLITDWYFRYFQRTPLVMLHGGPLEYAASRGAGWRGDCFGDYGMFSGSWNHMDNAYEPALRNPAVADAWKKGPVQFEACGVVQDWYDRGFDIDRILRKGLEWHMTVFNAKSSPIPAPWRAKIDGFLKRIGYRFMLREATHPRDARPGGPFRVRTLWENKGVAPIYRPWPLAYRLRAGEDTVAARWVSAADVRDWLPGIHEVDEVLKIPAGTPAGAYSLDVAILEEGAGSAHVELAIAGKRADRWYEVSQVRISD
jgi:hypothetical protein